VGTGPSSGFTSATAVEERRIDPPIHILESLDNLEILSAAFGEVRRHLDWRPIVLGTEIDMPAVVETVLAVAVQASRRDSP
jgi:hypothetical protein